MAGWKNAIRKLAKDFCITREETLKIFRAVESMYSDTKIPAYYKGDRDKFLYDKAQTKVIERLYA